MSTVFAITARHKGFNRAEIVDQNFTEFVQLWQGEVHTAPCDDEAVLPGSILDTRGFRELLESQLISRHLDLMARVLRAQNKVLYTIGSSGHEGNAMVARLTEVIEKAYCQLQLTFDLHSGAAVQKLAFGGSAVDSASILQPEQTQSTPKSGEGGNFR